MSDIVDIGFAEEYEPWRLSSRFFPSKIGGKPAWLDLKNLPKAEQLACDYCQDPCVFLCQVYAPYEENDDAFHRTIFLFICRNSDCCRDNQSGNFKVLRSQLRKDNEFYPSDPPVEEQNWRTDICLDKWSKTCNVCGIFSTSHCSKCKKINYCSRSHQIWDWKNGHKNTCEKEQLSNKSENFLFPEYELVIEREIFMPENENANNNDEIKKYEELVEAGKAGSLQLEKDIDDDLLKMASGIEDKTFLKFKKRIKCDPDQVIRYNRSGNPLFISLENQPPARPPKCDCGSERQFEFQIMPQLLIYLKLENVLNSIDWGTLLIYTCKKSCSTKSQYAFEHIWKQDIARETPRNHNTDDNE